MNGMEGKGEEGRQGKKCKVMDMKIIGNDGKRQGATSEEIKKGREWMGRHG